ncbi:MAG: GSU2403 family nucleotidyltransferase fold protein [Ramlibacter sp.]
MSPPLYSELELTAQNSFSELYEQSLARSMQRSIAHVPGSFNKKQLKSGAYWYWQFRDLQGKVRQVYLGPESEKLQALIAQHRHGRLQTASVDKRIATLAATCKLQGCETVTLQHGRVIMRLDDYGFFQAGGVLVGTHAFLALSNLLGVSWLHGMRTNDIDFAHAGKNVSLALPGTLEVKLHDALTSLEMGLIPAPGGATYLTPNADLRVDLITSSVRGGAKPFTMPGLGASLQPLKFMEYALQDTTQTVVIYNEEAVVVTVPRPMRYALHKILVMAEREDRFRDKLRKDAMQVAALLQWGLRHGKQQLEVAANDIRTRGPGWRSRLKNGLALLASYHPEEAGGVAPMLR